jgi:hypothetical protein
MPYIPTYVLDEGAWTTWTPTLTQSGPVSHTVTYAKYLQLGHLVFVGAVLTCTGAGTLNEYVVVGNLPVAMAVTSHASVTGGFRIFDAGTANYVGVAAAHNNSPTAVVGLAHGLGDAFGKAPNFALANTDVVAIFLTYEAA